MNDDIISMTKVSQKVEIGAEYKRQQEKFEAIAIPNTNVTSKTRQRQKYQLLNNYLGITAELDESLMESSFDNSDSRLGQHPVKKRQVLKQAVSSHDRKPAGGKAHEVVFSEAKKTVDL